MAAGRFDVSVSEHLWNTWSAPPVCICRWELPQAFAKAATPIKADKFGPDCIQARSCGGAGREITTIQAGVLGNRSGGEDISEDCLTLIIWTKLQIGEKQEAVLV